MELLKHMLGLCGENHASVLTLLVAVGGSFTFAYAKFKQLFTRSRKGMERP